MYYNEALIGSSNLISILLCLFIVVGEETNKEIIVTLNLKATKILLWLKDKLPLQINPNSVSLKQ